jgi:hypothetical protein
VNNFENAELLRLRLLNKAPKYGNDVEWVDAIAFDWAKAFADRLAGHTNVRGGPYQMGLFTVSALVPMGQIRRRDAGRPPFEGAARGWRHVPVYGRDSHGPTAVLKKRFPREERVWQQRHAAEYEVSAGACLKPTRRGKVRPAAQGVYRVENHHSAVQRGQPFGSARGAETAGYFTGA